MARLDGKVALISGGSRGMGASHARRFVEEGAQVVIGDILDDEGLALANELGDAARYVRLDVTSYPQWERAVAVAVEAFGRLDILINNAGITSFGSIEEFTLEDWDRVIAINLTGSFYGIKAAIEPLKASGTGSVVNISSTAGIQGNARLSAYSASKWGVRGLTKSVALDLGHHNIRVNSVHPGTIRTPMMAGYDAPQDAIALRRMGEPEELTEMVLFLASDESSFATGAEFVVDGGRTVGIAAAAPE